MSNPSMPVLESFTRIWPNLEAAHEKAMRSASALLSCRDDLLALLTRVATYSSARDELLRSIGALTGAPWELARNRPPQLARLSVFLPSNNILYSYALFGLIPALYCDQVIIRPSARFRDTAYAVHKLIGSRLDPDLAQRIKMIEISRRQFRPVCAESDAVVFTGRPSQAYDTMNDVGDRPLFLAIGSGPNPLIVGPRTDPGAACRAILRARLHNSGQDSLCPDVIFVHRLRLDAIVEQLRAELSVLTVGARSWPDTVLTPLVHDDAVNSAAEFLAANADHVVSGGEVDPERLLVEPSLLVFPEGAGFHPPELFSPVFCIVPYEDPEMLREWARSPEELERGMYVAALGEPRLTGETLGTAVISRNATALDVEDGNQPFGGYGVHASSIRRDGRLIGRPLLLSAEAGLRQSVITGPLR
ncbi:aldehyde dehydrogenase family protein [Streptomyces sp. NBC_01142]|uniref:aldehyde dehydrogenase family protein n=1 Tax=Streptomyces sp. NBC_01142 TaxID=2975865 RepID=UPI002256D0D3|nr:aldehyde dehydrogenase family protein [Streptomyces sp. NBC_01142]MCX4820531.1 aldehyde dehydrogenase family protein [Streptomyces sp. NBC_01142]